MMTMPRRRQQALDQIGHSLAVEDPGLGLRFAFFTMLTRDEAMPATEQVPDRWRRRMRRAALIPLIAISLAALLATSWLTSGLQTCRAGPHAAAHHWSAINHAAQCQPSPAIRLDTMPGH
jgi:hypothetical protein